jgi:glutathione peroxidase
MFAKVDVNGKDTHPLFEYLKNSVFNLFGKNIKWNFTKFLVDKNGNPVKRFAPMVKPEKLEKAIEKML